MPSVCFYFQVHQPFRLKRYSFFDIGKDHFYEDDDKNRQVMDKVAERCYLKTNELLSRLIQQHEGRFRFSFSISGTALEQFEKYRPDVLQSFIDLSKTGCVEFLSETYYHSLSFVFSEEEFDRQVSMHREKIKFYFNQEPVSFRNTELIYSNELAAHLDRKGYKAVLCEGVDKYLNGRSPNFLYRSPSTSTLKSFLKNYRLSDDIAFRFSDRNWSEWPLKADTFASWLHRTAGNAELINLFMDYETFGEHQWEDSGIFGFMEHLPSEILRHPDFDFKTIAEATVAYPVRDVYDVPEFTSWADAERDLSAWLSNDLEKAAAQRIYHLASAIRETGSPEMLHLWGKLQTSDHFYYMCTKFWSDGDVHKYFSPYDSPYDAYIYYMNVLADLETSLQQTSIASSGSA